MFIKYRFYNPLNSKKDYWEVGYVVRIANDYIKLSSLDPNEKKRRILFQFNKKIRLENILNFTEISEPPPKSS